MLLDEVYAAIDVLRNIVILLIVALKDHVEGNILELMVNFLVRLTILVYAEVVMTARIPYSFKMSAF
jgi:hypothetical protein